MPSAPPRKGSEKADMMMAAGRLFQLSPDRTSRHSCATFHTRATQPNVQPDSQSVMKIATSGCALFQATTSQTITVRTMPGTNQRRFRWKNFRS